jgi:hypothetical protein
MSQVTLQIGGTGTTTSFTFFTSEAAGRDMTSPIPTRSTATAPQSGAFISDSFTTLRPIRFTSFTQYFTSTSAGSVDLQISTNVNGSGGYQSAALTAVNAKTVTPNYATFHDTALWFGFEKNDGSTVRGYRDNVAPIRIFSNGEPFPLDAGIMRANLTYQTVPNAPTSVLVSSKTNRSITLSWTKPTDLGGPTTLTGYRILYKESSSSTWLTSGKFGSDTTTSGTISNLEPDTEYNFAVAATNSVTDSHNATYTSVASHTGTNSDQVTATTDGEVKVWTGSEFSPAVAKVWTGSEFATGEVYVWNGTEFVRAG